MVIYDKSWTHPKNKTQKLLHVIPMLSHGFTVPHCLVRRPHQTRPRWRCRTRRRRPARIRARGVCGGPEAQGRPRGPGMGWCLEDRSISISIDIEWYRFDMFFFGILYRVIQNIFRYLLCSNIWHTFWVRIGWNHAKTDSDLGIMGNHIALGFRWMT